VIFRNRIPSGYIGYAIYPYFSELSLRGQLAGYLIALSKEIMFLSETGYKSTNLKKYPKRKRKLEKVIDETIIKVGP